MIHQRQLFHAAVARMASSPAPLHDRILQAYEAFKSVRADDFMSEPNIRDAYIALLVMLKGGLRVSTVGSDISTNIRGLTGEQASAIAHAIVDFNALLCREVRRGERRLTTV